MAELSCPSDAELMPLVMGDSFEPQLEQHVEGCTRCSSRVQRLRGEIGVIRRLKLDPRLEKTKPPRPFADRFQLHRDRLPARIGRYYVVAQLGEGGQGLVYRAIAPHLAREVVIKLMKHQPSDTRARQRLVEEGRLLAELRHPNLVTVYDFDFHEGRPFLVLDYVRGVHLRQYVGNGFDVRDIAHKLAKVARALEAAHRRGIVHLDLKPQNIVINENGEPILIDFGLARLEDAWTGSAKSLGGGTPHYMAPEQARAFLEPSVESTERIGPAADVFGLGAVLYRILCGRAPFAADDSRAAAELASKSRCDLGALERSAVPRRLAAICRRAMQTDPAARYRSAAEMADALEQFASTRPRRIWLAVASVALFGSLTWAVTKWPRFTTGVPPAVTSQASFRAAIWRPRERGGKYARFAPLPDAVPIADDDLLQIEATLPNRLAQFAIFVYTRDHGLQRIGNSQVGVAREEHILRIRVPKSDDTRFRLRSPKGLCLIVVCARDDKPIRDAELERLLGNVLTWPALPEDDSCVEFNDRETWLPNARGAEFSDAPEKPVMDRIEIVRRKMAQQFDFLRGIVFQHR